MRLRDRILGDHLGKNSALAFFTYVVGHGLAFVTQLLMARALGAASYGTYMYVLSWVTLLASVAMLGFNIALLRFISVYISQQSMALLKGLKQYVELRVAVAGIGIGLLGFMLVYWFGSPEPRELRTTFFVGFLLVPLWAAVVVRCTTVRAYGGVISALVPARILREVLLLLMICVALWFGRFDGGAATMMVATLVGTVAALGLASYFIRRLAPEALAGASPDYDIQVWRQAALPLLFVTLIDVLFHKTGIIVLGWMGNTQAAGIYALVFNMGLLIVLPRTAINTLFAPILARLYAENQFEELRRLIHYAALLSFGTASAIAFVIVVLSNHILHWFGPEFPAGQTALYFILAGQLVAAGAGSQLQILAMTERESSAAKILAFSTALHFGACIVLANLYGLLGAAIASAFALAVWNAIMAYFIWRHLGFWPGVFGRFRYAGMTSKL